ncbi:MULTISPECIES: hypothetical protein [Acinetobacter]|nr:MULTISPECIES: hypothetical protein [Acinetobacter]
MADQQRKTEIIRSIEQLQLSTTLIMALDHASSAEAVYSLSGLSEQWN